MKLYNPWKEIRRLEAELRRSVDDRIRQRAWPVRPRETLHIDKVSVSNLGSSSIYIAYIGIGENLTTPSPSPFARVSEYVPSESEKCDGNHGGPRCNDPECWNDEEAMTNPTQAVAELREILGATLTKEVFYIPQSLDGLDGGYINGEPDDIRRISDSLLKTLSDAGYVVVPKAEYESLCLHDESEVVVPVEPVDKLWFLPVMAQYVAKFKKSMSQKELEWLRSAMIQAAQQQKAK